jgi:hypothetical protein
MANHFALDPVFRRGVGGSPVIGDPVVGSLLLSILILRNLILIKIQVFNIFLKLLVANISPRDVGSISAKYLLIYMKKLGMGAGRDARVDIDFRQALPDPRP